MARCRQAANPPLCPWCLNGTGTMTQRGIEHGPSTTRRSRPAHTHLQHCHMQQHQHHHYHAATMVSLPSAPPATPRPYSLSGTACSHLTGTGHNFTARVSYMYICELYMIGHVNHVVPNHDYMCIAHSRYPKVLLRVLRECLAVLGVHVVGVPLVSSSK